MTAAARERLHAVLAGVALVALVCWGWLKGLGRGGPEALVPNLYAGDAWGVMAHIKAYQTGELWPLVSKEIEGLGAPFGGNWTDYPAEDVLYFAGGLIGRVVGLEAATALMPMLLLSLAALAFYGVARALGNTRGVAFACAALFALSPFAFYRSVPHLTLTAYAHVPLLLAGVYIATMGAQAAAHPAALRRLAWAGAVLAGFLNPYYIAIYLVMLGIALVGAVASRQRALVRTTAAFMAAALLGFAVNSLDSLWMALAHGGNPDAVARSYAALDLYGLRLPDLLFPPAHRFAPWEALAAMYHNAVPGGLARGEAATAYVGLVAAGALAALVTAGVVRVAGGEAHRASPWFWMALATIAFAIVGGINHVLGAFGFVMLRASNRYSIVLACIALLWLAGVASRGTPLVRGIFVAGALALGLWDQLPPVRLTAPASVVHGEIDADRRFVAELEKALPAGSRVFQLPVKAFPETGPILGMQDYEHLRPYLFSTSLSFSYGSMKGRGTDQWHGEVAAMPPEAMVKALAGYGFGAIYVNRRAYADGAAQLREQLAALLGPPVAEGAAQMAFRLPASATPRLPPLPPQQRYAGYWGAENDGKITWAWASRRKSRVDIRMP